MVVYGDQVKAVEINFLCVHKKLRAKRLAPILIKEVTRKTNLLGIFQAVYTAGVVLPKPISVCKYWHRNLNVKKLIDVGFAHLPPKFKLHTLEKLNKLPDKPLLPGFRPLNKKKDLPRVHELLTEYLSKFKFHQHFS